MFQGGFLESQYFSWLILPLLIFLARATDVSIGTLRIVFLSRGTKFIAPILGFFEILIWLLAIQQVFKNLNNWVCYVAYAGGFAMGNYVGIWIENKLAIGMEVVRIITRKKADKLVKNLRSAGYGITVVDGEGATGPVKIIFMIVKRKDLPEIINMVKTYNPKAFYSVEHVQNASEGVFPLSTLHKKRFHWHLFKMDRKRK